MSNDLFTKYRAMMDKRRDIESDKYVQSRLPEEFFDEEERSDAWLFHRHGQCSARSISDPILEQAISLIQGYARGHEHGQDAREFLSKLQKMIEGAK